MTWVRPADWHPQDCLGDALAAYQPGDTILIGARPPGADPEYSIHCVIEGTEDLVPFLPQQHLLRYAHTALAYLAPRGIPARVLWPH